MTVVGEPRGAADTTSPLTLAQSRAGCAAVVVVAAAIGVVATELALRGAGQRPWSPRIELPGPEGELVRPHPTRGFTFHDERNTLLRRFRKNVLVAQHFEPFNWPYARLSHGGFRVLYAHEVVREPPLMRRSALVYAFERFYDDELEDRLLESHEVTKAILARLVASCRKRSVSVLVGDLSRDVASLDMLETARALGASTADMYVDLRLKENTNLPYDGHPSAWAHRQYAEKLLEALRAMGVS